MLRRLATLLDTLPTHWRARRVVRGPAARSRSGIRFVDLGNTWVRLREAGGDGPSLVFAADPPVPLELYDGLIAQLSDRYRITVLELPGFGCALPRIGYRFSLGAACSSLRQVLQPLPHGPHILVMPCVTGYVGLALARAHPELVRALILPQTPSWSEAQRWLQRRDRRGLLRTPVLGQVALALLRRRRARDWYASALGDRSRIDAFAAATLAHFDQGGCFCLASAFQDFLRDDHGLLGAVAHPALILAGTADPSHRDTDFAATRTLAPQARLVALGHVGHFPELEDPVRFAAELNAFFLTLERRP